MKNKDHMILEELYAKVKPRNIIKEEYTDKVEENQFIAKVDHVNVYNADGESYLLTVEPEILTLVYTIEIDFRNWGIKDFIVSPRKIMPFSIKMEDDFGSDDFADSKSLIEFPEGTDASDFKVSDIELSQTSTLRPTMIDLMVKKVGEKWVVVPEESEITF